MKELLDVSVSNSTLTTVALIIVIVIGVIWLIGMVSGHIHRP